MEYDVQLVMIAWFACLQDDETRSQQTVLHVYVLCNIQRETIEVSDMCEERCVLQLQQAVYAGDECNVALLYAGGQVLAP